MKKSIPIIVLLFIFTSAFSTLKTIEGVDFSVNEKSITVLNKNKERVYYHIIGLDSQGTRISTIKKENSLRSYHLRPESDISYNIDKSYNTYAIFVSTENDFRMPENYEGMSLDEFTSSITKHAPDIEFETISQTEYAIKPIPKLKTSSNTEGDNGKDLHVDTIDCSITPVNTPIDSTIPPEEQGSKPVELELNWNKIGAIATILCLVVAIIVGVFKK